MNIGEKIEEMAIRRGRGRPLTNKQLADVLGVSPTSAHRIRKGDWPLPEEVARVISHIGGKIVFDDATGPEYAFVRKVSARPSAGGGSLETSDSTEKLLAFRRDWLSSRTTSNIENISAMEVPSDSMSPTINRGDIILVDEGNSGRMLIDGKIYVVRQHDEIFLKRYRKGIGKMLFLSDNQDMKHLDFEVLESDADHFQVFGRAIWVGREL